jgi:succinyl-diaminopimelate desuccinylase
MDQIITLSKKIISIPSTPENKPALKGILDICKEELKDYPLKQFEKDGFQSLLFYNEDSKKFKIILNAHLDIVSAKDNQYKPFEKDGKLYGRGAYDMKSAAATMIVIFKELAKNLPYPIALQLVTDEEVGGFKGTKYQIEKGINADFVIAGENTDLKINHKSKGIIWLKIKTSGKTGHGAYPWLGENAILKMKKIIDQLEKIYPAPTKEGWLTTINLSNIETNNKTFNKIPDECTIFLDIRYTPEDSENVIKKIKQNFDTEAEIEVIENESAHLTNESNIYLQKLLDSSKRVLGKKTELIAKPGSSDIRHYNGVGIEGVTFGPIGDGHHSDNEWVNLKSVEEYSNILKDFLLNLS